MDEKGRRPQKTKQQRKRTPVFVLKRKRSQKAKPKKSIPFLFTRVGLRRSIIHRQHACAAARAGIVQLWRKEREGRERERERERETE